MEYQTKKLKWLLPQRVRVVAAAKLSTVLYESIKTAQKVTNEVLVAFSGGKDSIVMLDLAVKFFRKVQPFSLYFVPGLLFQERLLSWYENHYHLSIIRLPHFMVSGWLRYGTFRPKENLEVPIIGITDIYNYLRQKTGIYWIAAGEKIADSIPRRAMIKHSGTIDKDRGRFYPIAYWRNKEILEYIRIRKLLLGEDSKWFGFSFRGLSDKELAIIKREWPSDFKQIKTFFPFVEAATARYDNQQISKDGNRSNPSQRNKISGV